MNCNKYQLLYPNVGSKIYKTKSFDKAIARCYQELKDSISFNNSVEKFVVLNIDTNEIYTFKIKSKTKIHNNFDNLLVVNQQINIPIEQQNVPLEPQIIKTQDEPKDITVITQQPNEKINTQETIPQPEKPLTEPLTGQPNVEPANKSFTEHVNESQNTNKEGEQTKIKNLENKIMDLEKKLSQLISLLNEKK